MYTANKQLNRETKLPLPSTTPVEKKQEDTFSLTQPDPD